MKFTQSAFLFLILFVLFIVAEKGSFRNVLVNITVSLMLLFEMIFYSNTSIVKIDDINAQSRHLSYDLTIHVAWAQGFQNHWI